LPQRKTSPMVCGPERFVVPESCAGRRLEN
jgi:hypothetical protein